MFSDYLSITKIPLKNSFRRNNTDKNKRIAILLVMFLGFLPLIIMLSVGAYQFAPMAIDAGVLLEIVVTILTLSQFVVFFFGIFSILAYMFFSDDADFLAALPVKKSSLFMSKLTMVYINELILSVVFIVPMLTVIGISAVNYGYSLSLGYFILVPIASLLMPLIPLLLVSILAFPMMYVVSFFKKRAVLSTVVLIALFVAFMIMYYSLVGNFTSAPPQGTDFEIGETYINMLKRLSNIVFFNTMYARAMLGLGNVFYNLGLFILTLIGSTTISVTISSLLFQKSVMSQTEGSKETGKKGKIYDKQDIAKSALIKDFKMLVRNPGFAFQSFMGPILTPIILAFMGTTLQNPAMAEEGGMAFSPLMYTGFSIFMIMILLCGTNFVASVAFTREGKFFYFNKYLPIPYKEIIKGKVLFANISGLIGVFFATIVYVFVVDTSFVNVFMYAVALSILILGFSYMGIYRDLRKPKLEWNNVQEAVKQNLNAMFPMLIGGVIGMAIMIISAILSEVDINAFVSWLILWLIVYIPAIIVLVIYKNKLDNNYVDLINNINL